MPLTQAQVDALTVTERVVSVFSIAGIFFILLTFYFLKSFHKPINRLIFFASFGNLGMNIACLIAEDGIASGATSSLCTFQAFLIQMFLGVDAFWACCMAWNVYLAFFYKYTARQLRALDKWYLLGCYGASFVPALTLAFVDTRHRGRVYGPAILWCWIDIRWDFLRIALLYGIVWVAIVFAFAIYVRAGLVIYRRRDQLKGFLNPFNEHPWMHITTSIDITVEQVACPAESSSYQHNDASFFDQEFDRHSGCINNDQIELDENHPYIVNVEGPPPEQRRPSRPSEILRIRDVTREEAMKESPNPGAWLYARVAFLFFLSMLIIWIPSSVNRVYALAHPSRVDFPLNYISALVLPMQGLLNVVVYVVTSQTACRRLVDALRGREKMPWRADLGVFGKGGKRRGGGGGKKRGGNRGGKPDSDAEELVGMENGLRAKKSLATLGSGKGSSVSVPIAAHTKE